MRRVAQERVETGARGEAPPRVFAPAPPLRAAQGTTFQQASGNWKLAVLFQSAGFAVFGRVLIFLKAILINGNPSQGQHEIKKKI